MRLHGIPPSTTGKTHSKALDATRLGMLIGDDHRHRRPGCRLRIKNQPTQRTFVIVLERETSEHERPAQGDIWQIKAALDRMDGTGRTYHPHSGSKERHLILRDPRGRGCGRAYGSHRAVL